MSDDLNDDQYEVVIVRYGTRESTRSDVFLNYQVYAAQDAPITLDYFIWVVRGRERTFIIDTGFSEQGGRTRGRTMLIDPVDILRALDIDPLGHNDVIVTHGHYDHIGNLYALPNSRLLISPKEFDFWTSDMAGKEHFRHLSDAGEIDQLRTALAEGRLRFVEDGHQPAPGITVMEIGGHTPGQLAVTVQTPNGPVLLASDAVHFYEELDRDMPFIAVCDLPQMYDGYARIRHLLASRPHHLVTGHDASTLQRFPRLPGPLQEHAAVIGRTHPNTSEGQS
ncbi:N-acyl homoserine lactonase family protein [Streptomyces albidoflavus]|uniref:N-acyl homoserine lactonase family protein n=1 Tax=Streptomyces albidoflavus TaxID=1886 RepID=UPI00101E74A1|nr:N-acyl homoserine lactonase family protein [Streptomyces albidoflavus]RZD76770.1 N-acyl homoserine lactonase family protein [Streptomyces albidoflavus]